VYVHYQGNRYSKDFLALEEYLKRVWFSNGIYHHYGCEKFTPAFGEEYLREVIGTLDVSVLPLQEGEDVEALCHELFPVIFHPAVLPKRVNKTDGEDLVTTSACHFYEGVTQQEVERFYQEMKSAYANDPEPPSFGLNSTLVKRDGKIQEDVWCAKGRYGAAIQQIIYWLEKALGVTENEQQHQYVSTLIKYYRTGDLQLFNQYCIEWVREHEARIDFINGFIEVYGDPLGLKGSWEGIVEYKDLEATRRTQLISDNAQWFEDHSPVDPRFKKEKVKGVTAQVICAAMLGGDEYPSTAIGINLPNADWIRAAHGSKSVTIGNLTEAYQKAAKGNGFKEEFVIDKETISLIEQYGDVCDDLHTDLHECLGHGSGQLLPTTDPDALKAYGNTIEEARADLFGLYYIADQKLIDLGLVPDKEAYKSQYYTYMMNGLLTQLTRIKPGHQVEEAHMRNRALIAHWCLEKGSTEPVMELLVKDGKTFLRINDYEKLRALIATLLTEVQRIKSEGDYEAARDLVERYGVRVDAHLHQEILSRYEQLHLAPYKGFLNHVMTPVYNDQGEIVDIQLDYTESYTSQMLRYSKEYGFL
jgi:dipeptidyl-peptidase-3